MNIRVSVYTQIFTFVITLIIGVPATAVSRSVKNGVAKTVNGMGEKA
jgi:hypothetical protein